MKPRLLSIIIPIYNERNTVLTLLTRVYNHKLPNISKEMVIIESGSTDGTKKIIKEFLNGKKGVRILFQSKPRGKGNAVRYGLKHARGDIILIQDADLEYDVRDYERLIKPILDKKTSFVLGSRHLTHENTRNWGIRKFRGKERLYAYFMNFGGLLFHSFFNLLYGTNLSDPTTMYKVFDKKLIKGLKLKGNYFELDWEIVAKFIRLGHIPHEIPIIYKSRSPKEGKKVRFFRDVPLYVKTIIQTRFMPKDRL